VWHDNIARGDHENVEGVVEYDCALADHNNAFIAETDVHCVTDTYISDGNMSIAGSSTNNSSSSSSSIWSAGLPRVMWFADIKCALLIVMCIAGSNTVACRKHKGVVGWLCTKLEGSVGKLDLAAHKYYRLLFNRCT
jgi:hypothetical protein